MMNALMLLIAQVDAPELFPKMEPEPQTPWQVFWANPAAPWLTVLFVALVLLGFVVFVWAVRRPRQPDSPETVLRQRFYGLRQVQAPPDVMYRAVTAIFRDALAWRYQLPASVWTGRELRRALAQHPGDTEAATPAMELLAECEQGLYSGNGSIPPDLLDRADAALERLLDHAPEGRHG